MDAVGQFEVHGIRLEAWLPRKLGCPCEDDLGEFGTGGVSGRGFRWRCGRCMWSSIGISAFRRLTGIRYSGRGASHLAGPCRFSVPLAMRVVFATWCGKPPSARAVPGHLWGEFR